MTYVFRDGDLRKKYRSVSIPLLSPVLFNQTDVDRMITQIGERLVKEGLTSPPSTKRTVPAPSPGEPNVVIDIQSLNEYRLAALQNHPRLEGFDGETGKEVLKSWLRATVTNEVEAGRGASGPRIVDYLEPLSVAIYRTGLPLTRSKQRGADVLVYGMMIQAFRKFGAENPATDLRKLAEEILGKGIDFGIYPKAKPVYDGRTQLDIETMFTVLFSETFSPNDRQTTAPDFSWDYLVPGAVEPLGQDLVVFLAHIKDLQEKTLTWATRDVINVMTALISFRLLQLPLRLGRGLRAFVSDPDSSTDLVNEAWDGAEARLWVNPCQMYFDFTDEAESNSDILSKKSVARDLSILHSFQRDRMYIKTLEVLLPSGARSWREEVQALIQSRKYRQAIWQMKHAHDRGDYEVPASFALEIIDSQYQSLETYDENTDVDSEDGDQVSRDFLANTKSRSATDFDAFLSVIQSANEILGLDGLHKWFRTVTGLSVGGDRKPFCALRGTPNAKQTWRYSASDQLLVSLIYMCFAEYTPRMSLPTWAERLPLSTLLVRLRERFGVLVDQIPDGMDSPGAREAVIKNLEAFKARLKMLGCFEDLSDDLAAQYVRRPM